MDYFDLLHQAQINNKNVSAKETRCYKATFSAPKKVEKSRVSSENIKKFLARKEEEEKKKLIDEKKKKEELLALRALDKKAQKRVQTMLKRTKSANKSVMEDAIDNYNTKDTLEGPHQCDEDDYGYVSQEASAFYEKLMAKYERDPVENPKQMTREVKDLKAAKDRVKAALDREAEEQLHPTRKRKRKHDEDGQVNDDDDDDDNDKAAESCEKLKINDIEREKEETREKIKKIPKKPAPPPVDFFELMKIAAKKQHEPIVIEKKVEKTEERPLTKKEKLERQRQMERQNRKTDAKSVSNNRPSDSKPLSSSKEVIPNKNQSKIVNKPVSDKHEVSKSKNSLKEKSEADNCSPTPQLKKKEVSFSQSSNKLPSIPKIKEKSNESCRSNVDTSSFSNKSTIPFAKVRTDKNTEKLPVKADVSDIDKEIELLLKKKKMLMEAAESQKGNSPKQSSVGSSTVQKVSQNMSSKKIVPNKSSSSTPVQKHSLNGKNGVSMKGSLSDKDRLSYSKSGSGTPLQKKISITALTKESLIERDKLPSKFVSEKGKLLPKDPDEKYRMQQKMMRSDPKLASGRRKFSPPRYSIPSRPAPSLLKKKQQNKRIIDSESEYDSEMDDFIDDGPEECMDYSRHIKEIFGYDKSRYLNMDEDECEESSFRTQQIEERRSARIGLMEDLEDIQREKEEKERAKMKKKMVKR